MKKKALPSLNECVYFLLKLPSIKQTTQKKTYNKTITWKVSIFLLMHLEGVLKKESLQKQDAWNFQAQGV